jgi:hypothetical protein
MFALSVASVGKLEDAKATPGCLYYAMPVQVGRGAANRQSNQSHDANPVIAGVRHPGFWQIHRDHGGGIESWKGSPSQVEGGRTFAYWSCGRCQGETGDQSWNEVAVSVRGGLVVVFAGAESARESARSQSDVHLNGGKASSRLGSIL